MIIAALAPIVIRLMTNCVVISLIETLRASFNKTIIPEQLVEQKK